MLQGFSELKEKPFLQYKAAVDRIYCLYDNVKQPVCKKEFPVCFLLVSI